MKDKRQLTRRSALALVVGGSGLLLPGISGFTTLSSDRGVSVDVADDDNALLGLADASSGAAISTVGETVTVYDITDNAGGLSLADIDVAVSTLIDRSGTSIDSPPVTATVSGSGPQFTAALECDGETSSLGDSYLVVLDFAADTGDRSVVATRTTDSYVDITCTVDYGNESNYRDESSGSATQPTDPQGDIENPSAVNADDGNTATAISRQPGETAKVGYALPTIPSATSYELEIDVPSSGPVLTGTWIVYLLDESGTRLVSNRTLSRGENVFTFDAGENDAIRANRDELYLIFETTSKGNSNQVEIDYFQLRAT